MRPSPCLSLISLCLIAVAAYAERPDRERDRLPADDSQTHILMRAVQSGSPPGRIHALSNETFQGFVHCPAELGPQCTNPFGSIPMVDNKAYFRDVIIGAYTFISGASDGESWTATFTSPSNTFNFSGFTFHSNFNGQQDCFVSQFQIICGTTSIQVLWFLQSQCQTAGTWNAQWSNSTIPVQTFEMKSEIEGSRLPLQRQSDFPTDSYDETCHRNTAGNDEVIFCPAADPVPAGLVRWTIGRKGCYMTDVAMILSYHGFPMTPLTLNAALISLGRAGFDRKGNVIPGGGPKYASDHGVKISYPAPSQGSLRTNICRYGPQLVRVPNLTQHWVTAYGIAQNGDVLVRDPSRGHNLSSISPPTQIRLFSGPQFQFFDQITGMSFTFHSPVEAFVTDPMGRRAGFDPITQTAFNEIPNAFYDQDLANEDDENVLPEPNPGKRLEVFEDVDGDYLVTVTGTDTGTYDADILTFDLAGNIPSSSLDAIPTAPGIVQTYLFHFDHTNAGNSSLGGGFDGGGQRPRDVNKFLTYGNPSQSSTTLPAGTANFQLIIFYASGILPATFHADLNGLNVIPLFHPVAGTSETVNLPLAPGRNVLKLSIDGQLPSRVATDSDRLVLQVP